MVQAEEFKEWLKSNTSYSAAVITDTVSRMKRADDILEWDGTDTYLFYLEKKEPFTILSVSVRSQIRKATKLYAAYVESAAKNGCCRLQ